jgi:mannose-1-phosphate guanylyltransferase
MVLGAGLGTRLRPITYDLPKPMVPVLGRPVMDHILRLLARHGFDDVVTNVHHFADLIQRYFGDGSAWNIRLRQSHERELLGTAGGVRNVRDHFGDETFLVISGDALTDIDLGELWEAHRRRGGIGTLALKRVADPSNLGVVIVGDDGRIQGFQEKPDPAEALSDLGSCGIYVFEPEIFDHFPEREFVDWAQDVFPTLLERDVPFYGHETERYWNDIGSPPEYRRGNFDALTGAVSVELEGSEIEDGLRIADSAVLEGQVLMEPPVYIGEDSVIAAGVRLTGPVVIGGECRIAEGASLRDVVVWPASHVAEGELVIGGIAGRHPLAAWLER